MANDPARERPPGRRLIWKIFGIWPDPRLLDGPADETDVQRLDRGRAWLSSGSPEERGAALMILSVMSPDEALEPLLRALTDGNRHVRSAAFVGLLDYDSPSGLGDRIVVQLGGEVSAAECFIDMGWGAGGIGSFGLTERLLPHIEQIARASKRRKDRRRAASYARELRDHPAGWPMSGDSSPTPSA